MATYQLHQFNFLILQPIEALSSTEKFMKSQSAVLHILKRLSPYSASLVALTA